MLLASCSSGSDGKPDADPTKLSGTCGLPTPEPTRDESLVPDGFLPEGAEISNAQAERGGFLTAINVRLSVAQALKFYKAAVKEAGYKIINADNEGFEAEIYLRKAKRLAAIQIRTSTCDDRSIVFINEIVPDA
ncbi:MAG: hypothetical protein QOG04_250 [Actinomycetota bacterium]|nr:hypothetical protein [Actinomycetota bacterium]